MCVSIYYTTRGAIRGSCRHKHKMVRTAFTCQQDDIADCRQQGGYSDRQIIGVENGEEFLPGDEGWQEQELYLELLQLESQLEYH